MTKRDYQKEMESVTGSLAAAGERPGLLMQACCAPCSGAVLERVTPFFRVTLYYYNPNIWPEEEYDRRAAEFPKLLKAAGLEKDVDVIYAPYDAAEFTAAVTGLENEREGGERCTVCYALRLDGTAIKAAELGYDYFCTTLTVSPHKDPVRINSIGEALGEKYSLKWLPADFKKKDGYLRSTRLSQQYGLYRQNYCGCEYGYCQQMGAE